MPCVVGVWFGVWWCFVWGVPCMVGVGWVSVVRGVVVVACDIVNVIFVD